MKANRGDSVFFRSLTMEPKFHVHKRVALAERQRSRFALVHQSKRLSHHRGRGDSNSDTIHCVSYLSDLV